MLDILEDRSFSPDFSQKTKISYFTNFFIYGEGQSNLSCLSLSYILYIMVRMVLITIFS